MLIVLALGCVRRGEVITVMPDGSVTMVTMIQGDPQDVNSGDAMPSAATGWKVNEETTTDKEGKKTLNRIAVRDIAAGQALPISYAPDAHANENKALMFPTEVHIEKTGDGTYYHFKRVYHGRTWALVDYPQQAILKADSVKALTEKNPEELTDEERKQLTEALIRAVAQKSVAFFDQAASAVDTPPNQPALLHARRAILAQFESKQFLDRVLALTGQDDEQAAKADALQADLRASIDAQVRAALIENGVSAHHADALVTAAHDARDRFLITEDLGDDEWAVQVFLPGKIIAHNSANEAGPLPFDSFDSDDLKPPEMGDFVARLRKVDGEIGMQSIAWSFKGDALHDRDVVLMATSFVPAAPGGE